MLDDPFTKLYNTMVKSLRDAKLNVIDWNSSRDPEPSIPAEKDLPEFQVRPTGLSGRLGSSSCGTDLTRSYQILINSGDQRAGLLFKVEWKLLSILWQWQYGAALTSMSFVDSVTIQSAASGLSNADVNRSIKGWTAIWTIDVRLLFTGADLT